MTITAMKQALEALENKIAYVYDTESNAYKKCAPAITSLRQAITTEESSAVQEPVAWMYQSKADRTPCFMQDKKDWAESGSGIWTETPLYTHPQPTEERNFCPRCGKRTADLTVIHTCMPPKDTYTRPQPLTDEQIEEIAKQARSKAHAVTLTIKSLKENT